MPSRTTLFDHRASPIYEFGEAARNIVKFNPRGRLMYVAGFGNLSGEIVLFNDFLTRRIFGTEKHLKRLPLSKPAIHLLVNGVPTENIS